ncbi:LamG domain-containing protein [Subsaximicrobium wynnwilliamsii]|uniref:LamG domain-containing protein n=1 Tax=Subsaximicrobium wynnwilliamsii TaxID=291179 RepID=A0A5C6ZDB6_9FLAO|nr:LamG domain-containing protein [Subsaximicrobium wynnwilliamsii]TXD81980.1 LamG domain-containing protein [Subsaximicrobium wynnwilliamsii]TXD87678.1 LamG domain-containing protein [Subsaximicrobium wynnwilliamsii]TXE01424.1 LamG domain-containing protein [Subsaximicrobium wynnwilliamsii]
MKNFKIYILGLCALLMFQSCYEGIDEISAVESGPDAGAPLITIMKPAEGLEIQVPELVTSTAIEFKVVDDIEIDDVTVFLDGNQIGYFDTFVDYRTANEAFVYNNITTGDHVLTVVAKDISGNSTTSTSNFTKSPPYTPIFAGEQFYMPFDGDFTELISITAATEVGNPGFAGSGYAGSNAYEAGTGNHLSFPLDDLTLGNNFSAAFWYKVNATPNRAGILVIGDDADDRFQGFRLFREASGDQQRIKLNVGTGAGESWNDGGLVDPASGDWAHVAFTISDTETKIYINGMEVNMAGMSAPVDWSGCNDIIIGAGGPTFSYWDHLSDSSAMDELRLFNTTLSQSEITQMVAQGSQIFQMSFNGSYAESYSDMEATTVGNPGFAGEAFAGTNAYAGAADSYLTFPTTGLLNSEFTASFRYKLDADPDRAGILVIGPTDTDNPDAQNKRTNGFRFFRENAGGMQRFKLNVGNGEGENWFDGGTAADVDPATNEWVHLAFTISDSECVVYINGDVAAQGAFPGVDWTDCDIMSIMSGAPRFTGWGHQSDLSYMDELRIFDKALTQEEIQSL